MSIFRFDYVNPSELGPKTMLLTPGEASFKVVGVYDKKKDGTPLTTMDGTPKLNVSFSIVDSLGHTSLVYDDLTAKTAWKIKALLDSLGLSDLYDPSGALNPDDLQGGLGRCVIDTKKSEGYEDRTYIKKYLKAIRQVDIVKKDYSQGIDDTIPF